MALYIHIPIMSSQTHGNNGETQPIVTRTMTEENNSEQYACPVCGAVYNSESLARVHLTRVDDDNHDTYNGFMPEADIHGLSATGEVVDEISRHPDDIPLEELTLDDMPSVSEKHKHILLVASQNPYEGNYVALTELANERLEQHGIEPVSYSTIRRVIRGFYWPHESKPDSDGMDQFHELTHKQQGIVIERLIDPEASYQEISESVGCAPSYPTQVCRDKASLLDELSDISGDEEAIAELITSEISNEDLDVLIEENLLPDDLMPNIDTDESESPSWGSPVTEPNTLSAAPEDLENSATESVETDSTSESDTEEQPPERTEEASPVVVSNTESHSPSSEVAIEPELRDMQKHVKFVRDLFANVETEIPSEVLTAFATTIDQNCSELVEVEH